MEDNLRYEEIVETLRDDGQEGVYTEERESTGIPATKKRNWKAFLKWQYLVIVGVLLVGIVLGSIFGIRALNNNYKTPLKALTMAYSNREWTESGVKKLDELCMNGLAANEFKELYKVFTQSELLDEDFIEDYIDLWNEDVEDMQDQYGEDYKVKITVEDKEELDKDELKAFKTTIKEIGENWVDAFEDYESEDYEDVAEELDISKSEAKEFVKDLLAIGKIYKKVTVTEGYALDLLITYTGSELDDPEEIEETINVYKVNGRWISDVGFGLSIAGLSIALFRQALTQLG